MKTKHMMLPVAALTLLVSLAGAFAGEEKEVTISMDKVPDLVKKTLATYAAESDVKKVEQASQDGKEVYEFEVKQGKREFEVSILPDGQFQSLEEEMEVPAMPAAVQQALKTLAQGGKVSEGEKTLDKNNTVSYEALLKLDGKKAEVTLDENGKVLNTEVASKEKDGKD